MESAKVFFSLVVLVTMMGLHSALGYSFVTKAQDVNAKDGEDVTFNCELEGSGFGMVVWMNNSVMISFGRTESFENPRLAIVGEGNAYNLVIKDVGMMDEGEWECQVPGPRVLRQVNTLTIVEEPTITVEGSDLEVMEENGLSLLCTADGKPEPTMAWTKEGDDDFKQDGPELTIDSMTREDGGKYICTAINGIGEGDKVDYDVEVMFKPTVTVQEPLIHTGPGDEVELTCVFTSNPEVKVMWQHEGQDINLEEGTRFSVKTEESGDYDLEATLTIRNLEAADLGKYVCSGGSDKGNAFGEIELSGDPYGVEFSSDPNGEYSDSFMLEWEFFSVPSPIECELKVVMYPDESVFGENVVPSKVGSNNHHGQQYNIEGLSLNTRYGAKVNCRNDIGETGWSEEFFFNTSENENPAPPPTTTLEPKKKKVPTATLR